MTSKPFNIGVFTSNNSMIKQIERHASTDEEIEIIIVLVPTLG